MPEGGATWNITEILFTVTKVALPSWKFREVPSGTKNRNPVQDEFFNSSEALTEVSSLVRESIQNSLDAHKRVDDEEPVRVKFRLDSLDPSLINAYFDALDPHLRAGIPGGSGLSQRADCPYLIVEDFNTSGLLGDSRKDQLTKDDVPSKNSYHYFIWAEGASAKTSGNRGRWGIGKIVFPRLSEIKSFFVLSNREIDSAPCGVDEILIGMSILRGHQINGINYQPDGWWSSETEVSGVPIPVSRKIVESFKRDWRISRDSQTGLSIIIPFVPSYLTKEMIRDCVIRDYFIAVIQGLLEVEIEDTNGTYFLSKDNLRRECLNLGAEERIANSKSRDEQIVLIDMLVDSQRKEIEDLRVKISKEFPNRWNSVMLSQESAENALEILERGETLSCVVEVEIPERRAPTTDFFRVFIRKNPEIRTSAVFSREGITIPSANPSLVKDHLVLVISNSGPLANLLADAEGPAHEKWSEKTDKFRSNYHVAKGLQVLSFVRKAPFELLFKIRGSGSERDSTALSSFFPLPGSQKFGASGETPKTKGQSHEKTKPTTIDIPQNPREFEIDESPRGFAIKSSADNPSLIGKRIQAEVAYRVRVGDSFAKWAIQDFSLESIKPRLDGCILRSTKDNKVIIEITGRKFRAAWGNFDPVRDLDIRASFTDLEACT